MAVDERDPRLVIRINTVVETGTRLINLVRWALAHGEMSEWEDHSPEEAANELDLALKLLKGSA